MTEKVIGFSCVEEISGRRNVLHRTSRKEGTSGGSNLTEAGLKVRGVSKKKKKKKAGVGIFVSWETNDWGVKNLL